MPRQDSLHDQLKTVYDLANKAGCYDAADFIRHHIEETERLLEVEAHERCGTCLSCVPCGKCQCQGQ